MIMVIIKYQMSANITWITISQDNKSSCHNKLASVVKISQFAARHSITATKKEKVINNYL